MELCLTRQRDCSEACHSVTRLVSDSINVIWRHMALVRFGSLDNIKVKETSWQGALSGHISRVREATRRVIDSAVDGILPRNTILHTVV